MFFFTLIGNEIRLYISEHGSSNNQCQINTPCSFQSCLELISNETILSFMDQIYQSTDQLLKFQNFAREAISKGGILDGQSMVIDGSQLTTFFPAFLTYDSINVVDIENFTFIKFKTPILCTRSVKSSFLACCIISSCNIQSQFGLFITGGCNFIFYNVTFLKNTINYSSLISSHSSKLYLYNSSFVGNFAFHIHSLSFIYTINCILESVDSIFFNNSSPYSSFFYYEAVSYSGYWNCSFIGNRWTELLFCAGPGYANISNCTISSNLGSLFDSDGSLSFAIDNSIISDNLNSLQPFIWLRNSSLLINSNVVINSNDATNLIVASGIFSKSEIHNLKFISNNAFQCAIIINESASFSIWNSLFLNTTVHKDSLFYINSNSKVKVYFSSFERTYRKIIQMKNAFISIEDSHFNHISLKDTPIHIENGTLGILKSEFTDIFQISNNNRISFVRSEDIT